MSRRIAAYSKSLRVETISEIQNINNVSQPFQDVYSYTGVGYLNNFEIRIGNQGVLLRLEVDGEEVFNVDVEEFYQNLREFEGVAREIFVTNQPIFVFQPKYAVIFKEGFKIQIKSNDGGNWRDVDFGYVTIEVG